MQGRVIAAELPHIPDRYLLVWILNRVQKPQGT
jgi:hypothetical protein